MGGIAPPKPAQRPPVAHKSHALLVTPAGADAYHRTMAKTRHQGRAASSLRSGILPGRVQAAALVFFAFAALAASFQLLRAEMEILSDPKANLACDLNPVIACSTSLLSPQAHLLFGVSNSIVGIVAFSALLTLAVLAFSGVRLPAWIWWGMGLGTIVGLCYVAFFLWKSLTFFMTLCPYCMVIWAATIGASIIVWAVLLSQGRSGGRAQRVGRTLGKYWALFALLAYLIIVLLIVVVLRQQVAALFA